MCQRMSLFYDRVKVDGTEFGRNPWITTNAIGGMEGVEFYWVKEWPAQNMEICKRKSGSKPAVVGVLLVLCCVY